MKKNAKLFLLVVISLAVVLSCPNVLAKEAYYSNLNGVSLTQEEYEFFTKMYYDGYQATITQDEYQRFVDNNVLHGTYETKEIVDPGTPVTRGSEHVTGSKRLKIAKACSSNCLVSVLLTWLGDPTIRSYDVMGAYLNNVTLKSTVTTKVSSNSSTTFPNAVKQSQEGFGNSFKIPTGSGLSISQDFYTSQGGRVYASYQHAKSNTTLAVSQSYSISRTGFGGVFAFSGTAASVYDGMNGVDLAI